MTDIPAHLKPEVGRFIHRANQLRQVKPAIAYYCEYYAANQILQKKLHQGDQNALDFTMDVMSRLEEYKSAHGTEDVLADSTVGRIYVEEFAQDTFNRGEKVLRANRVTRNTADTFDAAATFLELGKIWGEIDEETQKKIKFAKWNAARILKAIKEGQDPNESNPKIEAGPDVSEGMPGFQGQESMASPGMGMEMGPMGGGPAPFASAPDAEGSRRQDLGNMSPGAPSPVPPKIPLGFDAGLHGQSPAPQNYYAAAAPSAPTPPSPLSAPSIDGANVGDPIVPSPYSHSASPTPQAPFAGPPSAGAPSGYSGIPPSSHSAMPLSFPPGGPVAGPPGSTPGPAGPALHMPPHHMPPHATHPQQHPYSSPSPFPLSHPHPPAHPQQAPSQWPPARPPIPPPSAPQPNTNPYGMHYAQHQAPSPSGGTGWHPPPVGPGVDVDKAQKHTKFAQSALNFDDVPTAVKELRLALAALGQQ